MKKFYYHTFFLLLLASCASENEYLVNPPPRYETVNVRFFNLAGDEQPRTLLIEGKTEIKDVPFGSISGFTRPPADSVFVEVIKNGAPELKIQSRFRFGRNMNYTFVALPSAEGASNARAVDTVVALSTAVVVAQSQKEAYLKFFNANPDTTVSYSMVLGCPSGSVLASHIPYRRVSTHSVVRSGEIAISIVKHSSNGDYLVGLYDIKLDNFGQYSLIVSKQNGNEKIYLLDEKNSAISALNEPEKIINREAYIKVVNFSSEFVKIEKSGTGDIASVYPGFVDKYYDVEACGSTSKDTVYVKLNGATSTFATATIDVLQKYVAFVLDSGSQKARKLIIAEPNIIYEDIKNKAIVRIVNANFLQKGISVSAGAREISNATGEDAKRGFRSGDILASSLSFGEISGYKLIEPGTLPIAVFTATEPAKLITTTRLWIEQGKSYFIVVYSNQQGEQSIALIEDTNIAHPISKQKECVFTQLVNAIVDIDFMGFALPGIFSNAKLNFSGALATIIEEGETNLSIAGKQFPIIANKTDRVMLIAAGSKDNPDLIKIIEPPVYSGNNYYVRRFVNASDIPKIDIKMNDSTLIYPELSYGERSPIERIYKERKFSLFFDNSSTKKQIARIDDLYLTFNKTYTIIFAGNAKKGYSVIVQQEY